jgi:programmed cell death protein 5
MADPNNPQPSAAEMKSAQVQEQKQMILEQACTQEALARLGRIKMVKPGKAASVENAIVSMAMQGRLQGGKINEGKLIEMLERGGRQAAQQSSGSINIQRKRYAFDSDDDDDDDEDLL